MDYSNLTAAEQAALDTWRNGNDWGPAEMLAAVRAALEVAAQRIDRAAQRTVPGERGDLMGAAMLVRRQIGG